MDIDWVKSRVRKAVLPFGDDIIDLLDELEELRAFKEEAENIKPVAWMHNARRIDVIHDEVKDLAHRSYLKHGFHSQIDRSPVDYSENYTIPLYAKPAPADKPAVAVPYGFVMAPQELTSEMLFAWSGTKVFNEGEHWTDYKAAYRAMLAAAPSLSQQSALTIESAKPIWIHGYEAGHNDGIGCGHSLAPRCRHSGEDEFYADDIKHLIDRCPSHESEQDKNINHNQTK